ncbi:N-acetyltransferase family protein [Halovenus marina]|uniref:GNAT family N-acetyltransferase n=1 Tax=Halovenus marina TaxID=3396621 RepID=UPI003F577641
MTESSASQSCDNWDNNGCEGTVGCPPRCPRFFDREGAAIHIRSLESEDIPSLVTMYEDVEWDHRTMGIPPKTRAAIRDWVESLFEGGWNLVALIEDKIVGHIGVAPAESDRPQFVVFVHQDYQGRGIGSELVKQLVAHAADDEYEALTLSASPHNERAIHLYREMGFEMTSDAYEETFEGTHVEMELAFPHPVADHVRLPPAER